MNITQVLLVHVTLKMPQMSKILRERAIGSTPNWPHNRRPCVCRVGERFADVNVVNRMPHGGGGVTEWAGISYGQRTQTFDQLQFERTEIP